MNQKEELKDDKKTESDTEFHLAIAGASHNFVFVNIMKLHLDLLKERLKRPGKYQEEGKTISRTPGHLSGY